MSSDRLNLVFLPLKKSGIWQSRAGPNRSKASGKKPSGNTGPAPAAGHPRGEPLSIARGCPINTASLDASSQKPTLIGLGEKTRFFFRLFDRTSQWCEFSLATEFFKTPLLLLGSKPKPLLRVFLGKIRNFCGFGFWVGFGFMEHGDYPNKHSIREGVPG